MTRLLYTKELFYDFWENVDWQELCKYMVRTCRQSDSIGNSIDGWKKKCCEIFQSLQKNDPLYNEYLDHLRDYLVTYIDISVPPDDSHWDSVFEKAMCTREYAISSREDNADLIDRRCLIPCWGARLQKQKSYPFVKLLCGLYSQYRDAKTAGDRCHIEYQSRLLFRDLLMYFEDIDLPNKDGFEDGALS